MKVHKKLAVSAVLILLSASLIPVTLYSRAASGDAQSAQLATLVQAATSSQSYALTVVGSANSQEVDTSSFEALLGSGNSSLLVAMTDLSSNSNLTGGIQMAYIAMKDFTSVSTGASQLLLQKSNFGILNENLAAIVSANATASRLFSAVDTACLTSPANASYNAEFQSYCSSGKNYISVATTDLMQANLTLTSGTFNQSSKLINEANANLSLAAATASKIAQFGYSERAQQYIAGPFASMRAIANITVQTQHTLALNFNSDVSQYQAFQIKQGKTLTYLGSNATSLDNSIQSALVATSAVSGDAATEQGDLSTVATEMSNLQNLVNTLPSNLVQPLLSDITTVQTDVSTASTSAESLNSQVGAFNQLSLDSLGNYLTSFQSAASSTESDNQALLTSIQTLQSELNVLAYTLPTLNPWISTMSSLYTTLSSDSGSLSVSAQSAPSAITVAESALTSYQNAIISSQIEVSATLLNSTEFIYTSEKTLLNTTALAEVGSTYTSIQTTSQESAALVAQSDAVLSTSVSEITSSTQSLSTSITTLNTQASSTLGMMTSASVVISTDVQIRTAALSSANLNVASALAMFEDLQISQGASLLAQANQNLQIASGVN